jgi:hypothetical protein
MTPFDIFASCSLSLAIALSWGGFRPIFSSSTDDAVLRSPVTTLASAIYLTSLAMALNGKSMELIGLVAISGLLLGILIEKSPVHTSELFKLSLAGALLFIYLSIDA